MANYNEFIAAAMCKRISVEEERLHMAFESLDKSQTGYISVESIHDMLGNDVDDRIVKEIFTEIDVINNGKLDYTEFLKYWRTVMINYNVNPLQKFRSAVKKICRS